MEGIQKNVSCLACMGGGHASGVCALENGIDGNAHGLVTYAMAVVWD